tara:strand:- start:185 stop:490 length:306 start_codon:yes stop_codon:yes gene_type:complete
MFQPQGGPAPGRGYPSSPSHQGTGSGDSSNNLFASGDRGVWNYVQQLEDKVKQLSEKVQAMENAEKGQEDRYNHLLEEVMSLRRQVNGQNAPQQPPLQGHS